MLMYNYMKKRYLRISIIIRTSITSIIGINIYITIIFEFEGLSKDFDKTL